MNFYQYVSVAPIYVIFGHYAHTHVHCHHVFDFISAFSLKLLIFSRKGVNILSERRDEKMGVIFTEFEVTDELPYLGELSFRVERIADPANGKIETTTFPLWGLTQSKESPLGIT